MSSIKTIASAMAGVFALTTLVSAETTVTLPDVDASIYGKLNYTAYYNEDTSGNATWTSGNNFSRVGLSISEGEIGAFGKIEVGVDMDDAGSDTFSSRLAYFGFNSPVGTVSIGRQNSVFTGVTGATDMFEMYGSNADNNQGSRLSNTAVWTNAVGPASVSTLVQMDGTANTKDIDIYEVAVGMGPITAGYSKNNNTEVDYMAIAGTIDLGSASVTGMYNIKDDNGTETKGYEVVATMGNITAGYGEVVDGDTYFTAGISQPVTGALSVYAEYQLEQNATAGENDQNSYAIGTKIVF